jgi:hypothetical protein
MVAPSHGPPTASGPSSDIGGPGGVRTGQPVIIEHVFDERGPAQRRNERSGALQRTEVRRVWVDLAVAYPRPVERPPRAYPEGVDLQSRVPGELLGWRRTTTGEWVGWVCVPISQGEEVRYVYQYVAAAALSPREDLRDRR